MPLARMTKIKAFTVLNTREKKNITEKINAQWGFKKKLDYAYLMNTKHKIFLINPEIDRIEDPKKFNIDAVGLYFGELPNTEEIRLSIEGSQMIGPNATKNVVELSEDETKEWMTGQDLDKETDCTGFVIIKSGKDFLGTGKAKEGRILNYVPKSRRINLS